MTRKESYHATVRPHPDQRQYRSGHPQGEQPLDLRRVVSDITADGGVALELSQNSDVTRTLRAPSSEQLIGPANGTWGGDAGGYRGSIRPSSVEFQQLAR
jgi:hypothetical protein